MSCEMTSMERVLTTLGHKEPDRVPLFLLFSIYGAKEANISIKKYFDDPSLVAKTQEHMRSKYKNDCFYAFYYAALELEAFGSPSTFHDDGPPTSGEPIIKKSQDILSLKYPKVRETPCLKKVLETIRQLKANNGSTVPIIGVVMSPFSLPVMQMGFDKYLDLMHDENDIFLELMKKNEEFCVEWANAQFEAGATAICYFDPLSSSSIIPKELYQKTGLPIGQRTISRFNGPTAIHMASGRVLPLVDDLCKTGSAVIGVSCLEDIGQIKEKSKGKISILGNLNGIEMCSWNPNQAESSVKNIIKKAAPGGGFILSDSHGEIPFQVKEEILLTISQTIETYGKYPIKP